MKTTKQESFIVESIAWRSSFRSIRCRARAITSAPTAPIAPPSVGVAMPRKMVPNTRKISPSGGISTKVTRSAILDRRPSLKTLFSTASAKAAPTPTHIETTMSSSVGVSAGRVFANQSASATAATKRMPSDFSPDVPSVSRMVRASAGRAGTHCGLTRLTIST